jgi:hypothetical protein
VKQDSREGSMSIQKLSCCLSSGSVGKTVVETLTCSSHFNGAFV